MNNIIADSKYHTHITSKHNLFDLKLKEVWQYRDLIVLFTKRSFVVTYKQTILGPAWIFINPFLTSIIYTFIFGGIAGISTDGVPQILFYLSSNAIWGFFSTCVTKNANAFAANANVFGKVYFPRLTIPISNVLASIIQFGVQMILVVVFLVYYMFEGTVTPSISLLVIVPVVLLHLGIMGLGTGIIISSLTTKYRDLAVLVTFGVQLWHYATPIIYPLSEIEPGLLKTLIMINPVTAPVELFRYALLGQGTIIMEYYTLSVVLTIIVAVVGVVIFNKVEKTFMDTV